MEADVAMDCLECLEVAGKTVKCLRLYGGAQGENELLIEFADGTSFSCCLESKSYLKATVFRSTAGNPEVLREYTI
jgi:uncharacterized protein (DUF1330 family)